MKKVYRKPGVSDFDLKNSAIPAIFAAGAALAGGYAVGRVVKSAMEAAPVVKLGAVSR